MSLSFRICISVCSAACLRHIFFFNATATTEIYTLSLHDALPICLVDRRLANERVHGPRVGLPNQNRVTLDAEVRSEEHTSELQSLTNLVCRLLLEKKKKTNNTQT